MIHLYGVILLTHRSEEQIFRITRSVVLDTPADGRGHTSISEAAAQGHEDVIKMLLAEGADPNALNDSGRSALWRSCYNGHVGALTLLLEAGADPSFRDKVCRLHIQNPVA